MALDEIVVKNAAVAINSYDYIIQEAASLVVSWVKLPFILGTDVAGEIVEVGEDVSRFKVGDRVVAHAVALDKRVNRACEGGFQEFTVVRPNMTSPIPQSMSYERACVMPLGLSTAACALFQKDYLALPFPTISPTPSGKTLLIWGGSTSVGCNAIHLATAAGYEVIATASPKNHEYLKKLGAVEVFDYRSASVVPDIISAFEKRSAAGAISIGSGAFKPCIDIMGACKGNKFIAQATFDMPPFPKRVLDFLPFIVSMLGTVISGNIKATMKSVRTKIINGSDLVANEVGKAVYEDFLPSALEQQKFIPAPEPQIVGLGLDSVQEAMDLLRKGVSAKKLVVTLY
ncbi:putative quinone oxidoreductase [Lindgomyces ingoldianus]|uniref:Quinone oxidoreductase n=1 Tax=Lindgomyces ingoldianus TaxID=673940 RepID=A0ACB6R4I0_9PLEO|nr:putative quinone oxidoreductase [Lindgomyces ingoldianus]KAF2473738.1 putative quinone oxidoreductase [Lindgomyces ingoldianus]